MSSLSVPEAAERLGVSRQRVLQMIAAGSLPAHKIGRVWAVADADVARHSRPSRRPLSSSMALNLLKLAAGERLRVDDQESWRLRQHILRLIDEADAPDGHPAEMLRSLLPRRANRLESNVAASDVSEILADDRLAVSGLSDRRSGMYSLQIAEGYVDRADADKFLADHFIVLADHPQSVNVVLHVARPVPPVSPLLVASDLADYRGDREDNQARQVLLDWFDSSDFPSPALLSGRIS